MALSLGERNCNECAPACLHPPLVIIDNEQFACLKIAYHFSKYCGLQTGGFLVRLTSNIARPHTIVECPSILKPSRNEAGIALFRKRGLSLYIRTPSYGVLTLIAADLFLVEVSTNLLNLDVLQPFNVSGELYTT